MTQTAKRFDSLVRFLVRILEPELSLWTWQRDIMPAAVSYRREGEEAEADEPMQNKAMPRPAQ